MYIVRIFATPLPCTLPKIKLLPSPGRDASQLPSQDNPSPTFGWAELTVLYSILWGYLPRSTVRDNCVDQEQTQ